MISDGPDSIRVTNRGSSKLLHNTHQPKAIAFPPDRSSPGLRRDLSTARLLSLWGPFAATKDRLLGAAINLTMAHLGLLNGAGPELLS